MSSLDAVKAIEDYRVYLLALARIQSGVLARVRLDPSDLVQMTLLKAHQCAASFRGTTGREQAAWMRRILTNTMIDAARRASPRDESIEAAIERSSIRVEKLLVDGSPPPGFDDARIERNASLATALGQLPDDQRLAVQLRYLQGLPLDAIAQHMQRTTPSVAGLLQRGLRRLREILPEDLPN